MSNLLTQIHGYNIYNNFQYNNYDIKNCGWNINSELFKILIDQTQPEYILELGTWYGASAICMANVIKELNLKTKIVCVDTWLGSKEFIGLHETDVTRQLYPTFGYPNAYYQFLSNICHYNLQDIIIPFPQTITAACKWLKEQNYEFDLIYVDGSNDSIDLYNDITHAWSLLKNNGIVFGDDYNNPYWLSINIGLNKFCSKHHITPTFIDQFPNHWTIPKQDTIQSKNLILVTCTYNHINRISYFKYLINNIFSKLNNYTWIIVEDDSKIDNRLNKLLEQSGVNYEYLYYGPTKSGGNAQRNFALEYIYDSQIDGIIYSVDDDNAYDLQLFEELRKVKNIAIFPVGGWGRPKDNAERPILDENHKFIKWNSTWQRKYATDMGGFAFHSSLLDKIKKPFWTYHAHGGGETEFIDRLVSDINEIDFSLCDYCSNCYVYHNKLREIQHPEVDSLQVYRTAKNKYNTKYGHSDNSIYTYQVIQNILPRNLETQDIHNIFIKLEEVYQNTEGCYGGPDLIEAASIIRNIIGLENSTILELGCWKGRISTVLNLFKKNGVDVVSIDNFCSEDGLSMGVTKLNHIRDTFIDTLSKFDIKPTVIQESMENIDWKKLNMKPISYIYYDNIVNSKIGTETLVSLLPFMTKNCLIEFHDSSWNITTQIIENLCNLYNFIKIYKIDIWEGSLVLQRGVDVII